jgi:hypothetical protein
MFRFRPCPADRQTNGPGAGAIWRLQQSYGSGVKRSQGHRFILTPTRPSPKNESTSL